MGVGEKKMQAASVNGLLFYCSDYRCSNHLNSALIACPMK